MPKNGLACKGHIWSKTEGIIRDNKGLQDKLEKTRNKPEFIMLFLV
jgi:hypothetical protein